MESGQTWGPQKALSERACGFESHPGHLPHKRGSPGGDGGHNGDGMEASHIDSFAEAEALVDEFGPRPPGSDAERRAAQHLAQRLEGLGREVHLEGFSVWPRWASGYAINAGIAIVGGVVAVYAAALGAGLVLLALILTFLDLAGITATTRR